MEGNEPGESGRTMFDIPLIQFRREIFFELLDVPVDPLSIRILVGREGCSLMTQRRQTPEVAVVFR